MAVQPKDSLFFEANPCKCTHGAARHADTFTDDKGRVNSNHACLISTCDCEHLRPEEAVCSN
jgi:hypothetical protein